jgi:hypothetical protein
LRRPKIDFFDQIFSNKNNDGTKGAIEKVGIPKKYPRSHILK